MQEDVLGAGEDSNKLEIFQAVGERMWSLIYAIPRKDLTDPIARFLEDCVNTRNVVESPDLISNIN